MPENCRFSVSCPMAFQPRELNTLIGCSKRLTAGRRVKARLGYSFFIGVLVYRIYRNNAKRPQFRGVLSWVIAGVICTLVILALTTGLTQPAAAQLAVVAMLFPTLIYFGACVHLSQRWITFHPFLERCPIRCTSYTSHFFFHSRDTCFNACLRCIPD